MSGPQELVLVFEATSGLPRKIDPYDLVSLKEYEGHFSVRVKPVYADAKHPDNQFPNLYHPDALLWAHKDMAKIVLVASVIAKKEFGWELEVRDCLRPVEAQEGMSRYGHHADMVSPPGAGGHPRAMAIDIVPYFNEVEVDMGTKFDAFADDPVNKNPAARNYTHFSDDVSHNLQIWQNRVNLEFCMRHAATILELPAILPLPQEWWDFRFEEPVWSQFPPLEEADLLPHQRVTNPDFSDQALHAARHEKTSQEVLCAVNTALEKIYPPRVDTDLRLVHS